MYKDFSRKRKTLQAVTSVGLPVVLVGGWFYPWLGFFLLLCMAGAVGLSLLKGRTWCDWFCPRGSFLELFLKKAGRKGRVPGFMKAGWFRASVLSVLLLSLGVQVYMAWGDPKEVGLAFVRVLTVTTTAGIVLGALFDPRAWCHICPMGTIGGWVSKGKNPLYVNEACRECKLCSKVCPMDLQPYKHKDGAMENGDCLKCSSCVAACPINALEFKEEKKKKAA